MFQGLTDEMRLLNSVNNRVGVTSTPFLAHIEFQKKNSGNRLKKPSTILKLRLVTVLQVMMPVLETLLRKEI